MPTSFELKVSEDIQNRIYSIRDVQVMLDRDLAILYKVETRVLNQAVKRNIDRFPDEFCFQLTNMEFEKWKSQIVMSKGDQILKSQIVTSRDDRNLKSQIATSSWGGRRTKPYAFSKMDIGAAEMLTKVLYEVSTI